jgi:DNA-binding SARP family transcriptional activator/class 3 adenylate cyclase
VVRLRILGPLEATEDGRELRLGGAKQCALLAILALHRREVVSTDRLIDGLWDGRPPASAPKTLQGYVSHLRKALGPDLIVTRGAGYLLAVEPTQVDLDCFESLVAEGRDALAQGDARHASDLLVEALGLWRGKPLADLAYAPFAQAEIARLEDAHLEAIEERIEADLTIGRHQQLVGELESLVKQNPLRERLRVQLMLALYRCGRQAEALASYREARQHLVEELGIEPGRELQELERAILRQDAALDLALDDAPGEPDARASIPPRTATPDEPSPTASDGARKERKLVSVLFAELVDYADRGDEADPEDVDAALERFSGMAKLEIERFGGIVESFVGDVLLAVFGAPAAHEDDAERAVRSAMAILIAAAAMSEELRVRIAVDTGIALVSLAGRPEGTPITAGGVVSSARRLLAETPAGGVLVGDQTHRATSETIDYGRATSVECKGTSETISGWRPVTARNRRGVELLREPTTPLVGRKRELDLLASTLARAVEERSPQLVTLVGVPGIGKSRLVFELSKRRDPGRTNTTWLRGRCLPYGDGVSFWALGEIVKQEAGILESDDPQQAEEKLHRTVSELMAAEDDAAWVERELRPLVGAATEPDRREVFGEALPAWRRFLERLADRGPLVLVLEDIHWADDGLLEFLDELTIRVRDAALLLVCTARLELLERRPGWGGGKANALTVSLTPLSDKETATLVQTVLERSALETDALEALLTRAGGNPLYAEQLARALTEVGSPAELPETVYGIIAARIDALLPMEKAVLQDAAVVGDVFWSGAVEALGEVGRRQADDLLFSLERKEFVQRGHHSSVEREFEYAFRHVLLRDVAYGQIPRAVRAKKHRRAASWIESLGRPDDHAEMLAHHYWKALECMGVAGWEDPVLVERARLSLRAAGDRSFAVASYATAARYYARALELWPTDDPDRAALLVHAGHAQHAADGTGIDLLEQGFEQLRSRGRPEDAAEVAVEIARRFWLVGERDAAYAYIERARTLVEGRGESRARAYALVERAAYHMSATEHPQAIRLMREALPLTESLGLDELRVRALDVLGSSRASLGDLAGLEDARRAVALARELSAFYRLLVAELNLQGVLVFVGQCSAASEALRACRADVERYGTGDQRDWLRAIEAHEAVLHGEWEDAIRILDERLAEAESGRTHYSDPACHALRSVIALARDGLPAASADSERALEGARRVKDPQLLAPALTLRAIVQLERDRPRAALKDATVLLAQGSILIPALLELHPTVTPVELAWLMRDLGLENDLASILESAPPTPWHEAARAIATGDFLHSIEVVAQIGAPSVDAYARLRAAEALVGAEGFAEAEERLAPAVNFFRRVRATRYLARVERSLTRTASM